MLINVSCGHFNIYEQGKFRAQLSWVWKKFYNLGAWSFDVVAWDPFDEQYKLRPV